MLVRRRMRTFATVTTMVANMMSSASTSSKFDGAAERFDQHPGQKAADDCAEGGAGTDQPEQSFRLTCIEERARVAPRVHRRDDSEAVHPDVEHGRQRAESARD